MNGFPASGLKIRAEIPCEDVNWTLVRNVLCSSFKRGRAEAGRAIALFSRKIARPLNLELFCQSKLSLLESEIVCAVCEVHGADSVTLVWSRVLRKGGIDFEFRQRVEFEPPFSRRVARSSGLECASSVEISLAGLTIRISGWKQALLAQAVLFGLGVALYVVVAFCLLYALAVFLFFLMTPDIVTIAATRRADIGLALLAFLVASAWISGRAVSNLLGLIAGSRARRAGRRHSKTS